VYLPLQVTEGTVIWSCWYSTITGWIRWTRAWYTMQLVGHLYSTCIVHSLGAEDLHMCHDTFCIIVRLHVTMQYCPSQCCARTLVYALLCFHDYRWWWTIRIMNLQPLMCKCRMTKEKSTTHIRFQQIWLCDVFMLKYMYVYM